MMFRLVVETAAKVPFNTVYCKVYESGKFPFSWLLDWMEQALSVVNHTGELESCYQASLDAANQESTEVYSNLCLFQEPFPALALLGKPKQDFCFHWSLSFLFA